MQEFNKNFHPVAQTTTAAPTDAVRHSDSWHAPLDAGPDSASLKTIRRLPSDYGRKTELKIAPDGRLWVHKIASDPAYAPTLHAEVRQLRYLRSVVCHKCLIYPQAHPAPGGGVLREYIRGQTLMDTLTETPDALARQVVRVWRCHVFCLRISATKEIYEQRRSLGKIFPREQLALRQRRFELAIRETGSCSPWLDRAASTLLLSQLAMQAGQVNAQLSLSLHGDLTPNNVILTGANCIGYIDLRANWHKRLPLWDPVMDLSTLVVTTILGLFAKTALLRNTKAAPARLEAVHRILRQTDALNVLACGGDWMKRFHFYLRVRLLGIVGTYMNPNNANRNYLAVAAWMWLRQDMGL